MYCKTKTTIMSSAVCSASRETPKSLESPACVVLQGSRWERPCSRRSTTLLYGCAPCQCGPRLEESHSNSSFGPLSIMKRKPPERNEGFFGGGGGVVLGFFKFFFGGDGVVVVMVFGFLYLMRKLW